MRHSARPGVPNRPGAVKPGFCKLGILRLFAMAGLVFFLLPASLLFSASPPEVQGIRYRSTRDHTRVVVDLSRPVKFKETRLKNPDRLYVDLSGVVLAKGIEKTLKIKDNRLGLVRAGQFNKNTARVVVELKQAKSYRVFKLTSPDRLVIDVFGDAPNAVYKSNAVAKSNAIAKSKVVSKRKPRLSAKPTIVIDPGHGGKDPGAIGPKGLKEKDVTLDVALKLRAHLRKAGYRVFLTRTKDKYIALSARTDFANKKHADMFVSIHVNASRKKQVRGIETYLLNWTDNEEAQKVAARENAITLRKMKQARSQLGKILASLELQNKRDESLNLAHLVQNSVVSRAKGHGPVVDKGVKQAYFYVLVGARMPSVLAEVSYISNPEEERMLKRKSYRESLARGIAAGVKTYMSSARGVQKVAKRQ